MLAAAAGRSEAGHREGDLIIGENNRSAAVTLTERVTRQTLVAALPHGYDARHTADAVTAALACQPRHLVRTLTCGPRTRDGPLDRHRSRPRRQGLLL